MAKTKEALLEEAAELGINIEGLEYNELRTAVKNAKELNNDGEGSEGEVTNEESPSIKVQSINPTVQRHLIAKKKRAEAAEKVAKAAEKQAAKADQKKGKSEKKKEAKDTRAIFTDDRGLKFRFKKTAPESLNFDGKSYKITDIIKSEEIMLELVYGNSNHIEQIY